MIAPILQGALWQQVLAALSSSPQLALALLPAQARVAYDALRSLPAMVRNLEAQWNEYNNAIEGGPPASLTPAQRTQWAEAVRQKGIHLQNAQDALDQLTAPFRTAIDIARAAGIMVPPIAGLNGAPLAAVLAVLGSPPVLIIASAIAAGLVITAIGMVARELAAAARITLGLSAPPPATGALASIGIAGVLVAGAVLFFMLRSRR